MRVVLNPLASREPYTPEEAAIVSRALAVQARAEIGGWPDYAPTPLRSLDALARTLGLQRVFYKDESARLRQGSFKILGGAYAATVKLRGVRDLGRVGCAARLTATMVVQSRLPPSDTAAVASCSCMSKLPPPRLRPSRRLVRASCACRARTTTLCGTRMLRRPLRVGC